MIEVSHTARSQAPRSEIWRRLTALERWHEWGPWTETTLDAGVRTLVSERRRITGKPYVMRERVTEQVPEERFEYDLLEGLPVRGYHAVVTLADAPGGGTDITWRSSFEARPRILGGPLRRAMQRTIREVAEALAAPAG